MLIYSYKGKLCPTSNSAINDKNIMALLLYERDILNKDLGLAREGQETLLRQVFNTYSTLCQFNNYLAKDELILALNLLESYLKENSDTKLSVDNKCRDIYNTLDVCYKRLSASTESLDSIKKEIVATMKYYVKLGLFKVSNANLKSNYYDFV